MVGCRGRLRGFPVAPQVRADHRGVLREPWRHSMPGCVRPRVTVQEQNQRTRAAVTYPQDGLAHIDTFEGEIVEHDGSLASLRPTSRYAWRCKADLELT